MLEITLSLILIAIVLYFVSKVSTINNQPCSPTLYFRDQKFVSTILAYVPELYNIYRPPPVWGSNGHMQALVFSLFGRIKCPTTTRQRKYLTSDSGATITYDVLFPAEGSAEKDVTLFIVPGFTNNSDTDYIRSFSKYLSIGGYKVAILNHTGTLPDVPLTSPAIFTFGHTDDLHQSICDVALNYPATKLIAIGFSMGGNLVTKYFGEVDRNRPNNLIAGISACQPYDALRASRMYPQRHNLHISHLYHLALTQQYVCLIMKHRSMLLSHERKAEFNISEREIVSASSIVEIDDVYTRKVFGFRCIDEYYRWVSSAYYLKNITTPMVFINSLDDPLIPEVLLETIRDYCKTHDGVAYIETKHGGHLGFFEGNFIPHNLTWLDRILIKLINPLYENALQKAASN